MATLPSGEKVLYIHGMLDGTMEQLIGELVVLIYRQMERLQEGCQASNNECNSCIRYCNVRISAMLYGMR
jgi:hypothetical protein